MASRFTLFMAVHGSHHKLSNKLSNSPKVLIKANRGSGGVDGQSLEGFAGQLEQQLDDCREPKDDVYRPQPVRWQVQS